MDYKTKKTNRKELRRLAKIFDIMVGTEDMLYKPVVQLLDIIQEFMPFVTYDIVENDSFEIQVPARGYFNDDGIYIIEIKEYVYENAIKGNGACRGFIMHEILHPFMLQMGFLPVYERRFNDGELPAYESGEWQVKAITGEYMMNYEKTNNMSQIEIVKKCGVSKASAKMRKTY